ncbi:hypothetical protein [Streptomyces lushanensis]|uniref:hypothetical protein n=1 Tax=Streptomyces lushanensis TaxID=1434255 RepID=UPI00114D062F|nr:hypothetical protein [Streptomyces lushanensis]
MATSPGRRGGKRKRRPGGEASSRTRNTTWGACAVNALMTVHVCGAAPYQGPQTPPDPVTVLTAAALSALTIWLSTRGAPNGG